MFSYIQLDGKAIASSDRSVSNIFPIFDEDELSEGQIHWEKNRIQTGALWVLRKMKAHQAIPDLETIMNETTDKNLINLIQEAITQIKSPLPEGTIIAIGIPPNE